MYVFHRDFGWGKIVNHDLENKVVQVDFTDYPYGEEKIEMVQMNTLQNPQEKYEEIVRSYNKNPDDFRVLPIVVYRDRMNDGDYIAYDEVVCVPKEIANKVHYAKINFTMDSIAFYDVNQNYLMSTASYGYDDLVELEAFTM